MKRFLKVIGASILCIALWSVQATNVNAQNNGTQGSAPSVQATNVNAQNNGKQGSNPCEDPPIHSEPTAFDNPPNAIDEDPAEDVLETTLIVDYTNKEGTAITISGCPVHLRSYNGQLVGPTLRAKPGDTIKVHLKNALPKNAPPFDPDFINVPHGFNTTNLHTHGLHVSPKEASDNVLLKIHPAPPPPEDRTAKSLSKPETEVDKYGEFDFIFEIPEDHPSGTYWYHPHVHGATAVQVASGMAGALIIEDKMEKMKDETTTAEDNKALDAINDVSKKEKIFVFEQIVYDKDGKLEPQTNTEFQKLLGPGSWEKSKHRTTINGLVYPKIKIRAGEVQRWRFIHAGFEATLKLTLEEGPEKEVMFHEIAVDGINLKKIDKWKSVTLQPGQRSDVLVQFKEPGTYKLVDEETKAIDGSDKLEGRHIIAQVEVTEVTGDKIDMTMPEKLPTAFVEDAPKDIPQAIAEFNFVEKLDNKDTKEILDTRVNHEVIFTIDTSRKPPSFESGNPNGTRPYDPSNKPRLLKLGDTQKWKVSSGLSFHPFHIHVNPFQVIRERKEKDGADQDEKELVWRDVILLPASGEPVTFWTKYERFPGDFVMHCHILRHEDEGMMELVRILTQEEWDEPECHVNLSECRKKLSKPKNNG